MAITLWKSRKPFDGMLRLFDDLDTWFDNDLFAPAREGVWAPAVDIEEKDGSYLVKADLPGLKKDDIHIELHDSYLTLKAERHHEKEENKDNRHWIERSYGSFERTLRVPEGVTEKDITAKYNDGVLELNIPAPKAEKPKAIEVKVE